jgi:prophage antirepressor-like protein
MHQNDSTSGELSQEFVFETHSIRAQIKDSEPWWMLADVCAVLEIANSRNVVARLEDDQLRVCSIDTSAGQRQAQFVSESGLWSVILGAKKNPKTKPFQDWVTREVMPSIRKTGAYSVQALPVDPLSLALKAALETREMVLANDNRVTILEADVASIRASAKIEGSQIGRLHALGQALGKAMGDYRKGWGLYKDRFVLASYRDTLQKDYAVATKWLEAQIQLWGGSVPLFKDAA